MNCQVNVSFVGQASIVFFRDMGKLQNVVNFDYDHTLLTGAPHIHYYFQTRIQIVSCQVNVSFVGEAFIFFSKTWVNCKVLSILTVILFSYLVRHMSIITFILKFKL